MSIILLVITVIAAISDFDMAKSLALAFVAHTFGGRAAGIGLCIISGMNLPLTIVYNFYLEILIVCFTYSIFVLSLNNYIKFHWVESLTARLMEKADKHKEQIRKYGWLGIFLFVMVPLPVTGPVVGSTIGYLLKMNLWHNFTAVFLGTLAAIIGWTFGFDFLEQHVHIIQYILIGILLLVLGSYMKTIKKWLVEKISDRKNKK